MLVSPSIFISPRSLSGVPLTDKRKLTLSSIIVVLAALVLLWQFSAAIFNYARLAGAALDFRYPLDYGEGPLLDQTLRLLDGEQIYKNDFSAPPYTISNYPPLFLLVQAPFARLFGPAYWYGRGLSLFSALITAALIGLTLYTLTGSWLGAAVGGLLLLSFPYDQYWSLLNRIDTLALVFSWAGIFVVVRYFDRRWGIAVGAAFLIAAIYTRQSYALAAPAGAFFFLLGNRRFRKAINLALIVGGVCLGLFLIINLLSSGGFFLNIVSANVNPFFWDTVKNYFETLSKNTYLLLGLIAAFLLAERFGQHSRTWVLALVYLITATASAVTVGKDGSNVNYMYELAAALSFAGGAALVWLGRNPWVRAGLVLGLALQVSMLIQWTHGDFDGRITDKTDREQQVARLFQEVQETDGILLTDEYMGMLPLAGKRIYYQPFEYKMLSEGGLWDDMDFMASIVNHEYSALLLYDPPYWSSYDARWSKRLQSAINASYQVRDRIADTEIWKPRE